MDLLKAREKAKKKIIDKKSNEELESRIEQVQEGTKAEVIKIPKKKKVRKIDQSKLIAAKERSKKVDKLANKKKKVPRSEIYKGGESALRRLFPEHFGLSSKSEVETAISASESKIEQVQEGTKTEVIKIPEKEVQKIDQSELITAKEESKKVDELIGKKIEEVTPSNINEDTKHLLYMLFQDTFEPAVKVETAILAAPSIEEYAQYLVFRIGNELYGIDLELVSEVIRYRTAAYIPNAPNYVYGLITLRGHMVPIIHSHLRLNLTPTSTTSKSRIVIIEMNREYMGFTVDEAYNVISIDKKLIKPPPPTLTEIELELIAGVYEHEDRLVILLNKDNFFKFL